MTAPVVLVLQGPNLNLLGVREPEVYGSMTLTELQQRMDVLAAELHVQLRHVQSNHEGELVDAIQVAAADGCVGAIVNAGAYTHTSVAIRDALVGTALPFVEVHLSNVFAREEFRHVSMMSDVAIGVVTGLGAAGYEAGLRALVERSAG